jgi:hypothetical protein
MVYLITCCFEYKPIRLSSGRSLMNYNIEQYMMEGDAYPTFTDVLVYIKENKSAEKLYNLHRLLIMNVWALTDEQASGNFGEYININFEL